MYDAVGYLFLNNSDNSAVNYLFILLLLSLNLFVCLGCSVIAECLSPAHPELDCPDSARHCYDGLCICSRFPVGPGR